MREFLHWDPSRCWFVDWCKDVRTITALDSIRKAWPAVNVVNDDVRRVIANVPHIGFANLDFMGGVNYENVRPALYETAPKLAASGILGLTWFRGREWVKNHSAMNVLANGINGKTLNEQRWLGVKNVVEGLAAKTKTKLKFISGIEYQHKCSAMSVAIWQRV